jgi:hypothetical protein
MEALSEERNRNSCLFVSFSSMLRRKQEDPELLFHQAGLYYDYLSEKNKMCIITPHYYNVVESIARLYPLQARFKEYSHIPTYLNDVSSLLSQGALVAVFVDAYELEFSSIQNRLHTPHCFEIISCGENSYEIQDHYYHHRGTMERSTLIKLLENSVECLDNSLKLYWIEENTAPVIKKHDYLETIESNYLAMKGSRDRGYFTNNGIIGLNALEAILVETIYALHREEPNKSILVNHLFTHIKEIANSRYNFHIYLTKFGETALADCYLQANQSWTAFANIILKASVMNDPLQIEQRLMHRAQLIRKQEEQAIEEMSRLLLLIKHTG